MLDNEKVLTPYAFIYT